MNPAEIKKYQDRIDYYENQTKAVREFGTTLEKLQSGSITGMTSKGAQVTGNKNYNEPKARTNDQLLLPDVLEVRTTAAGIQDIVSGLVDSMQEKTIEVGAMIGDLITGSLTGFGEWLGSLFTGEASLTSFLNFVLTSIADFAIQMGKQLIAVGIGVEAFKTALKSLSGIGAVVAGIALVALGTGFKALMAEGPKMKTGGIIPPGFSNDSYPAWLSSGETVVPNPIPLHSGIGGSGSNSLQNITLQSKIRGNDIYLSNNRTTRNNGRIV